MELKSANAGANWHPLTSLITFDSLETHRVHYFLTALDGTPDYFSTLLHEFTHLMSARFGRFGFFLARVAAREYSKWQQDRSARLTLNQSEWRVLGAYVPLLEGLAIYTQLDFAAEENEGPHYSPLYLIGSLSIADHTFGKRLSEQLQLWRRYATAGEDVSLLEGLLLDKSREDLNYYTFGYFYVKAIQAQWAQRCPAFNSPALFLPFFLKFVTDHPVLLSADDKQTRTEEILTAIHKTLIELSAADLKFLNKLFSRQTLSEFDHCDIYRQLETRATEQIWSYEEEYIKPFINDVDEKMVTWMVNFRACNAVYIYSWCEGTLKFPEESVYHAILESTDGTAEAHLVQFARVWYSAWEETINAEKDEEMQQRRIAVRNFLLNMEKEFFETLAAAAGKQICLAGFITLFRSMPGLCLWIDGEFVASVMSDPWHLLEIFNANATDEMYLLGAGLRIPPTDRVAFAKAFTDNDAVARQARTAGDHLLTYLVSSPERLKQRLAGLWKGSIAEAREWTKGFPAPYPLPQNLRAKADEVFNLPGFAFDTEAPKVGFAQLIPAEFAPL